MNVIKKRGLSPVIATVLLVLLAVILAVIVFLWARSFIGENIQKQEQKIELICEKVNFVPEAIKSDTGLSSKIYIQNNGDVPLYGIEVRTKKFIGSVETIGTFSEKYIYSGETGEVTVDLSSVDAGETLLVVPILLGETDEYKKAYVCDKDYGKETIVKSS